MVKKTKLVPPDGGYGWVIVFAGALSNFVLVPMIQTFGLIFKDTFVSLGFTATEASLIINVNQSFGMITGLINSSLLNYYGYRKISFAGGFCLTIGVTLTSFATTFTHFMILYGLIASMGLGLCTASYSLAVNTYFKEKRNKAVGLMITGSGLGPIIMPQVIDLLIKTQTISGVTLILGAICGHSIVAAALLQPVKWHMKRVPIENPEEAKEPNLNGTIMEENEDEEDEKVDEIQKGSIRYLPLLRSASVSVDRNDKLPSVNDSQISLNYEQEGTSMYGQDVTLGCSVSSLATMNLKNTIIKPAPTRTQWWKSASTVNLDSSVNLFDEIKRRNRTISSTSQVSREMKYDPVYNHEMCIAKTEKQPVWRKILKRLYEIFDLKLLQDRIYVNIMMGMSLAVFAEMNFSVLTPFILDDLDLTTSQIATFMSVVAITDIIFRFLAPYIGDLIGQSPRVIYMITLLALIITRFGLVIFTGYSVLITVAAILGIAKGVRSVYMSLVIPCYVPLERLASASGIQMMVNGVIILIGGPLLGLIRDITGSYRLCIIAMNGVTFLTISMWSLEFLYMRCRNKPQALTMDG